MNILVDILGALERRKVVDFRRFWFGKFLRTIHIAYIVIAMP